MKHNRGGVWRFIDVKEKSGCSWKKLYELQQALRAQAGGVALVQLEDYTNVSLVGKSKTDLRSPFRSDLGPVSSNGFYIDTSLKSSVIISISPTDTNKGGG